MCVGSKLLEVLHCENKKVKLNLYSLHVLFIKGTDELQHSEKQIFGFKLEH